MVYVNKYVNLKIYWFSRILIRISAYSSQAMLGIGAVVDLKIN